MEAVDAAIEVETVEAGGVAMLNPAETGGEEFTLHFLGAEEEAERLAGGGDASGEQLENHAAAASQRVGVEGVVEAETGASGEMSNSGEGGAEGFEGEVRGDTEPAEEGRAGGVKAGFEETGGEGLVLEVEGDIGEVGGDGDFSLGEHVTLPLLRGGVVDLKDVERWERVAVGEGVEAGAEDNVLRDAASDCDGELIFREAAAGSHEAAEVLGDGVAGALEIAGVAFGDEWQCDGVVENAWALHQLVCGTADGDAQGGSAGLAVFHESNLEHCGARELHTFPP